MAYMRRLSTNIIIAVAALFAISLLFSSFMGGAGDSREFTLDELARSIGAVEVKKITVQGDNLDIILVNEEKAHAKRDLEKVIVDVKNGIIESFRMKIRGIHAKPYGGQAGGRQIQLDKNGFTIIRINGEKLKRDIIESPVESIKNTEHPAVYPLYVVQEIIKLLSNPNDIVLDPFVGSGTTCIAARNLKRNYIGIEIDPNYVKYANSRLKKETELVSELLF